MLGVVAMSMQELPITVLFFAAEAARDNMVNFQQIPIFEERSTEGAFPALSFE